MIKNNSAAKILLFTAMIAVFSSAVYFFRPVSIVSESRLASLRIFSREGIELRSFTTQEQGNYAEWLPLEEYPDSLIKAVITAEDMRFFFHRGIDPFASARASLQLVWNRCIISGGSTITQQLARSTWERYMPANDIPRKLLEMLFALKIEMWNSKEDILECYMNRIPLKYNRAGFASASRRIFGRDPRFLTAEEEVALAVLVRRSETSTRVFKTRFTNLWYRLNKTQPRGIDLLTDRILNNNGKEPDPGTSTRHFQEWLRMEYPGLSGNVRTSLSASVNKAISNIVNSELLFLKQYDTENAAVVVLSLTENDTLPLVAMLGSRDFTEESEGQVNGCTAIRQAGSTLKPFLYALAMDRVGLLPNTIIEDKELILESGNNEVYIPRNYDLSFWGRLTVREALGASRNIPALDIARRIGLPVFYDLLIKAGFTHMTKGVDHYGYGLALGSGGASLMLLTRLYSSLAKKGIILPVFIGERQGKKIIFGKSKRLFSEKATYYIRDILSDREIRRRSNGSRNFMDFPYDVAAKTGTSKDYRDAWTLGFTEQYVVGVWVGNFSGTPMKRVSGAWGSGRIFHQVVRLLTENEGSRFTHPSEYIYVSLCRNTGKRAGEYCPAYNELLHKSDIPEEECSEEDHSTGAAFTMSAYREPGFNESGYNVSDSPLTITSPAMGETYIIDPLIPLDEQPVSIRISCNGCETLNTVEYMFIVDGSGGKVIKGPVNEAIVLPRGEHNVSIIKNKEIIDSVTFFIK